MSKKVEYRKFTFYDNVLNHQIRDKRTFETYSTSYTKKIKNHDKSIIFNPEGHGDMNLLALINKVRRDAKKFINTPDPGFVPQFDLFDIPSENDTISKIDIKGAYWEYAKKANIISKETDEYFITKFSKVASSHSKMVRLKALGSLATKKIVERYIDGQKIEQLTTIQTEDTRNLYMSIRHGIDSLIRDICRANPGVVYYYVDCLFVRKGIHSKDAIDYLLDSGYKITTEDTKVKPILIGNTTYLESISDKKRYLTRLTNEKIN